MPECTTCGSHLSKDYLRVCGDNEDSIDGCLHCPANEREEERLTAATGAGTSSEEGEPNASKLIIPLDPSGNGTRSNSETVAQTTNREQSTRDARRAPLEGTAGQSPAMRDSTRPRAVLSAVIDAFR